MNENKLMIEELKEYFRSYKVIKVGDFKKFYNNVYEEVNPNTVSWNIYKLKEAKIIRHISRGQYELVDKDNEINKEYVVITMDIIDSSSKASTEFNQDINEKIKLLNKTLNKKFDLKRKFHKSYGDEIQIIIPFNNQLSEILILTLGYLHPFKVRYGISVGILSGELRENSWEMNEPILWNARDQLEKLKQEKKYAGLIISGYINADNLANNLMPVANRLLNEVTDRQWDVVKGELTRDELEKTLNDLNIRKASYYETLKSANFKEILAIFNTVYGLLELRREIN